MVILIIFLDIFAALAIVAVGGQQIRSYLKLP
jgi:hypothetical protein